MLHHPLSRRQINHVLGGAALGALLGGPAQAQTPGSGVKHIRISTLTGADTPEGRTMRLFIDQVEKESNGRFKVDYLPSSDGGKLNDSKGTMYPAMLQGRVDIVIGNTTQAVGATGVKELELWDMPFLFNTVKEADAILDGPIGQRVLDQLSAKGFKGLMYMENGFRNLTNDLRPIERPADMRGLKIRVIGNPVFLKTFKMLGAEPVGAPFDAVYDMLKKKEINTAEAPFGSILDKKWYEVQKYLTVMNYVYSPYMVSANLKWWEALTADDRALITRALRTMRAAQRAESRRLAAEAAELLKAKGMVVNTLSYQQRRAFAERLTRISSEIAQDIGLPLWAETNSALSAVR